jgi:hypothetical protein
VTIFVLESSMKHFFIRAEMARETGQKAEIVDNYYERAAHLASLAAPYRHALLSAMKLAGDPNNPVRFKDDATAEELRAEMMRRIAELSEAGIIDLQALPLAKGIENRPPHGVDSSGLNGD